MSVNTIDQVYERLAELDVQPPPEGFGSLPDALFHLASCLYSLASETRDLLFEGAMCRASARGVPQDQWPTSEGAGATRVVAALRRECEATAALARELRDRRGRA